MWSTKNLKTECGRFPLRASSLRFYSDSFLTVLTSGIYLLLRHAVIILRNVRHHVNVCQEKVTRCSKDHSCSQISFPLIFLALHTRSRTSPIFKTRLCSCGVTNLLNVLSLHPFLDTRALAAGMSPFWNRDCIIAVLQLHHSIQR